MGKLFKRFKKLNLVKWYEKHNAPVTQDGLKRFARTVITLSLCAVTIVFIWYLAMLDFNLRNEKTPALPSQEIKQALDSQPSPASVSQPDISQPGQQPGKNEALPTEPAPKTQQIEDKPEQQNSASSGAIGITDPEDDKKYSEVKETIYKGSKKFAQVALTFDDGYDYTAVDVVLDVLKERELKCTFFIIGKAIAKNPEIWKRAIDEGHQICNHTQQHQLLTSMSDKLVQKEITDWEKTVEQYIGKDYLDKMKKEFPFIRLPGGGGNKDKRILSIAQKNGYAVIGWNLETYSSVIKPLRDTHTIPDISKRIKKHVLDNTSNGSIVLLHFNKYDIGNLDEMIDGILDKGFQIKTVDEII